MRRKLLAAVAAISALALGAAPAEAATKPTEAAALGFPGPNDRAAVLGAVRSPASRCERGRTVALVAQTDGDPRRLGTDLTSRNGGFYFEEKVPQNTTNLVVVVKRERISKQLTCKAAGAEVLNGGSPE